MGRKKVIIGVNDLSSKYPDLVKEWDYEKNTIKPSRIYPKHPSFYTKDYVGAFTSISS